MNEELMNEELMNDLTFEKSFKMLKVMHQSFFTLNFQLGTSAWI
jgi:hypothetical protein